MALPAIHAYKHDIVIVPQLEFVLKTLNENNGPAGRGQTETHV